MRRSNSSWREECEATLADLVPCSLEETFSGETKKPRRCEKPRLRPLPHSACASARRGARRRRTCGGKVTTPSTASDGEEAVFAWQGEVQVRAVHSVSSRQGEVQLRGLQPLRARQGEVLLRGLQPLRARQAETHKCADCNPCAHGKLKGKCADCNPCPHGKLKRHCVLQPLPAWQAEEGLRGLQPLPAWQAETRLRELQPVPTW